MILNDTDVSMGLWCMLLLHCYTNYTGFLEEQIQCYIFAFPLLKLGYNS